MAQRNASANRWLLGVGFVGACSLSACTQEVRPPVPTDCSVEERYDFRPLSWFNESLPLLSGRWYVSGDRNATIVLSDVVTAVTPVDTKALVSLNNETLDEPVCGHTEAKVFRSEFNHDWGSNMGNWNSLDLAPAPTDGLPPEADASAYEGLSFWAYSKYHRVFAVSITDAKSSDVSGDCIVQRTGPGIGPDPYLDKNGLPVKDGCGSPFLLSLVMDKGWNLYTLPFSSFYQTVRDPRLRPEGMDPSALFQLSFRVTKDTFVETYFTNFAWYRPKQ